MNMEWDQAAEMIDKIEVVASKNNELVKVKDVPECYQCVGVGTDAAVFRSTKAPEFAFKVFSHIKLEKMEMEKRVYDVLGDTSFFPRYYGSGENYLVLSYEDGLTLYDCLIKGIEIPKRAIEDVEEARAYAKSKGLNPRDIHLRNILLHNGRAKLLDVSEYMKQGNDTRWECLKAGYMEYYYLLSGKPIPVWILETVRKWYNQCEPEFFNEQEFIHKLFKLFKLENNT
nr:serine/threonine protein kinase [Halalkalibacter akibai]